MDARFCTSAAPVMGLWPFSFHGSHLLTRLRLYCGNRLYCGKVHRDSAVVTGGEARMADEVDWHTWAQPGAEDLGGGVYRLPLPLPAAGLKAVNVYALLDERGVDLIDAGPAFIQARDQLSSALRSVGATLGDVRSFFVTHMHRDHYSLAAELRRSLPTSRIALGAGEKTNLIAARALQADGDAFHADMRRMGALALAAELISQGQNR